MVFINILKNTAIKPYLTGVFVSCLEKNPVNRIFIIINAGNPNEYAIKLRELASLRDDGIITDQEFKKMKEGILFKK